jgi:hypothetical protein
VDKTDANPGVFGEQDEEGDDSRMDAAGGASSQGSVKKRKKSAVVLPDGFVTTQTRSVAEASVMVVDGMCLMLTDSSPDKCSQ